MLRSLMLLSLAVSLSAAAQQTVEETPADARPAEAGATEQPSAETAEAAESSGGVKTLSGMSILGNEEAPKSLVIVPWKSSRIGDGLGVANLLDERARPVDKEVFLREVHYYELRSGAQR